MEKIMQLLKVSPLMTREFKRNDGTVETIKSRMLTLSDGVDTIYGETTKRLTNQIEATDDNIRLRLIEGHVYNCDFNIRATEYEKDGKKSIFVGINIDKIYPLV